jgi:ubiquinone/menaquinone biosynthesis C-methylase UbiE
VLKRVLDDMKFADFPWPRLADNKHAPVWVGNGFRVGSEFSEILSYGESESAWSDELTAMHEAEASTSHPIDLASRALAVRSMQELANRLGQLVLDIGCSSGFLIHDLQTRLPTLSVFGADYLSSVVVNAARRNPGIPFVQFDLRKCPLPDKCVDGVTALNVLEHIDDDFTALNEIFRILTPGGIAHVEVPAGPECFDLYDEVLMHFRRYRLTDLIPMAERIGFEVQFTTHLGFLIYPAFRLVKSRNRARYSGLPLLEKQSVVKRHISTTGSSLAMRIALGAELNLGRFLRFPFGIRAVVKLSKPS